MNVDFCIEICNCKLFSTFFSIFFQPQLNLRSGSVGIRISIRNRSHWTCGRIIASYMSLKQCSCYTDKYVKTEHLAQINPLKIQLNPICHLLALLGAHPILHVSRIMFKLSKEISSPYFICQSHQHNSSYCQSPYLILCEKWYSFLCALRDFTRGLEANSMLCLLSVHMADWKSHIEQEVFIKHLADFHYGRWV